MSTSTFAVQGIGYDAGVIYEHDFNSRPDWTPADVRRDFLAIRRDLGCTAVLIMATSPDRLIEAGRIAREIGLEVWLQPRRFDEPRSAVVANLAEVATQAEQLRIELGGISLNVGCEISLSTPGFLPGRTFIQRGMLLGWTSFLLPLANHRLRQFLRTLAATARAHFGGPISYGAGDWEQVDWDVFDVVGLDLYLDAANRWRFADDVRAQVRRGKPVIAFEFGCCSYVGAAENASLGFTVLREVKGTLQVPATLVRDEGVQADYLDELFDLFGEAGVHGVFPWGFSEPRLTRSHTPEHDLDLASYGVVAVAPPVAGFQEWTPKAAFFAIARRYHGAAQEDAKCPPETGR